jgi:hypothetical protein
MVLPDIKSLEENGALCSKHHRMNKIPFYFAPAEMRLEACQYLSPDVYYCVKGSTTKEVGCLQQA